MRIYVFHTALRSNFPLLGGNLRRDGVDLASRTLETAAARCGPRQRIALAVGYGDDGVVEDA